MYWCTERHKGIMSQTEATKGPNKDQKKRKQPPLEYE